MHCRFSNVNDAFRSLITYIKGECLVPLRRTSSRVGDVIQITEPMTLTYLKPLQRVLFNKVRDCNPVGHVVEALWMLAGRNDVATIDYYMSKYSEMTSDDGKISNGAYGYRWRRAKTTDNVVGGSLGYADFNNPSTGRVVSAFDQLAILIDHLKRKPDSRRAVLSMWNVEDDLLKIDTSKDVCCNLSAVFEVHRIVVDPRYPVRADDYNVLNMTVFNRSNDTILGALGANYVHFSFLQEYMATALGIEVGVYNQISCNLHLYTRDYKPDEYLGDSTPDHYWDKNLHLVPFVKDIAKFDEELPKFVDTWCAKDLTNKVVHQSLAGITEPFLRDVAFPMVVSYWFHKRRLYGPALQWASEIMSDDWRIVVTNWMQRRKANWDNRTDNPMLKNEEQRIMEETGAKP